MSNKKRSPGRKSTTTQAYSERTLNICRALLAKVSVQRYTAGLLTYDRVIAWGAFSA